MPQIVVVRRRHGNAGIVRNIAAGVAGGLAAGWGAIAGRETVTVERIVPAAPAPAPAPAAPATAPKTFTEAEVDETFEEAEDMIIRYMTNPDFLDETRKAFVQFLGEFNRTFRGE